MNDQLRNQSLDFLTNQCEPDPEFQLALLYIIQNHSSQADQGDLQYQAILFMKNSLTRLFQANRNRKAFKSQIGNPLTEGLKEKIKAKLLELIQQPDGVILQEKSYIQLTLVACIFVKYDFPANWQQLNQWLLDMFQQLFNSLGNLSIEQVPNIRRFLKFYLEVMKEQNKKKLITSKGQFHKVAREHLKIVFQVWQFFNEKQLQMIYDQATDSLNLANYNEVLFELASKLDKCLLLDIACGFSLNDLLSEQKNNLYVKVTQQLIEKTAFFTNCVDKLSQIRGQQNAQNFYRLFEDQIKSLLKHISELQFADPLIVFECLAQYIETVAAILFRGDLHNDTVKKQALFAFYRIVNTNVYNQSNTEKQNYSDGIGILVSPSKFKNFEPQLQEAGAQYQYVLEKPDPNSKDVKIQNRKDGARAIIKLVFQNYLPFSENVQQWQTDPETFIELEDENYFISEFDMDAGCSANLLAYQLLERLVYQLYGTSYSYIKDELLSQYFNGQLVLQNEFIEDALLSIVGMLGKIQKDLKISQEKRLDIVYVLDYIHQNKWQNPLFKRRYMHILTQWTKLLPKSKYMDYFRILVQSLTEVTDYVLIYEHCRCIHELIKEIDHWIKKSESGEKPSYAQGSLFDSTAPHNEEEDQIKMSISINRQIDYAGLFSIIAQKLIPMLSVFQNPTLMWNMMNYITKLLEKNSESQTLMVECFKSLNLLHMLEMNQKLLDEAVIDMLKNLFVLQPDSSVILEMCASVLDYKLAKKPDSSIVQFWVYTIRAVSGNNASLPCLKNLFSKYIGLGDVKESYMAVDFFKIVQEYVMLNFFTTKEEIQSLISYVHQKFNQEIEYEKQWIMQNQDKENINYDTDDDSIVNQQNIYEKKLNLVTIIHLILWKSQTEQPEILEFALLSVKDFMQTLLQYFIEYQAVRNIPSSSTFYTQSLTFINRAIIVNREFVLSQALEPVIQQKGYSFNHFLDGWFTKMDLIVSQESKRINLLAIFNLLPYFSGDQVQKYFNEIGRLTFTQLDSYMYLKLTNNESRFYSPSKLQHYHVLSGKVKINSIEKVSQRMEQLKKEDSLLNFDIVDHFWQRMEEVKKHLNIPQLDPLATFLVDNKLREIFGNLISGNYPGAQAAQAVLYNQ